MAEFSADVYQNEFLPDGATDVHAIVTLTCRNAGAAGQTADGDAAEVLIVDTSGSMGADKIAAAQAAAVAAIDQVLDGVWFALVAGNHEARLVFPHATSQTGMVRMDHQVRQAAKAAVASFVPDGGTAMGTWLRLAARVFASIPTATQKHAILLTDGINQHETPEQLTQAISVARGQFQCDCRGVGTDWQVAEVRRIATELLGTVGLIPQAHEMAAEFSALVRQSMGKGVAAADPAGLGAAGRAGALRPAGEPQVEDVSARRREVNALTGDYPTGSWGDESRDYHVSVRLPAKSIGAEQLAARVQLVVGGQNVAQALVKAMWSDDDALTARINPAVAHYTGQAELAQAIQDGLAAKASGDDATATAKLGRAVQLAQQTGNEEATSRLKKVVEVEDPGTGRVRLKKSVDKLDEMALDTASTKTTRVRK